MITLHMPTKERGERAVASEVSGEDHEEPLSANEISEWLGELPESADTVSLVEDHVWLDRPGLEPCARQQGALLGQRRLGPGCSVGTRLPSGLDVAT